MQSEQGQAAPPRHKGWLTLSPYLSDSLTCSRRTAVFPTCVVAQLIVVLLFDRLAQLVGHVLLNLSRRKPATQKQQTVVETGTQISVGYSRAGHANAPWDLRAWHANAPWSRRAGHALPGPARRFERRVPVTVCPKNRFSTPAALALQVGKAFLRNLSSPGKELLRVTSSSSQRRRPSGRWRTAPSTRGR